MFAHLYLFTSVFIHLRELSPGAGLDERAVQEERISLKRAVRVRNHSGNRITSQRALMKQVRK